MLGKWKALKVRATSQIENSCHAYMYVYLPVQETFNNICAFNFVLIHESQHLIWLIEWLIEWIVILPYVASLIDMLIECLNSVPDRPKIPGKSYHRTVIPTRRNASCTCARTTERTPESQDLPWDDVGCMLMYEWLILFV